jgi:hypothetical protein
MAEFILIDLKSQYQEVVTYVKGMTSTEILDWMKKFGEVHKLANPYDESLYSFISHSGLQANFRINEANELIVFQ